MRRLMRAKLPMLSQSLERWREVNFGEVERAAVTDAWRPRPFYLLWKFVILGNNIA